MSVDREQVDVQQRLDEVDLAPGELTSQPKESLSLEGHSVLSPDAPNATPAAGKPGLPVQEPSEPEPESDWESYEEDADKDEPNPEEDVIFTEENRREFVALEAKVTAGKREAFEALREIRQRQLWRQAVDDQGRPLCYSTFDAYCEDRWGHSRQWVTHGTNWVRIMEELESLGFPVPHLTVKAAQGLLSGRLDEAGGLRAVLEEAKEDGVQLDRDHLREIVTRRADFNYYFKEGMDDPRKPFAETYAEYKKDLAAVKELGEGTTNYQIIGKAKELPGDFANNLVALCQREQVLPSATSLLSMLTGKALQEVVFRLNGVALEQAENEEKKNLLKSRQKQLKELLQDQGLKAIRDEAKKLEQELTAKGVLKRKGKPHSNPQAEQPTTSTSQAAPPNVSEEEDDTETGPESEVCASMALAFDNLEEALSAKWPTDDSELNAILLKAQECEEKLAAITAKVKELLADIEQPQAVTGGDD